MYTKISRIFTACCLLSALCFAPAYAATIPDMQAGTRPAHVTLTRQEYMILTELLKSSETQLDASERAMIQTEQRLQEAEKALQTADVRLHGLSQSLAARETEYRRLETTFDALETSYRAQEVEHMRTRRRIKKQRNFWEIMAASAVLYIIVKH